MLPKMPRPSSTAATIEAKLSSVSVSAAASLATSVPVMPIAMPMSAFLSAGASLTPSPVIATTWPWACSAVTTRSLCEGETRAKTVMSSSARSSSASSIASSSAPETTRPCCRSPISRAIASAVTGWSPVIITTRMPAVSQVRIAAVASGRGGSSMPTSPRNVSPDSASAKQAPFLSAIASVRRPSLESAVNASRTSARPASSRGTTPSAPRIVVHAARITSGAPLANAQVRPSTWCKVVMHFLAESNGISSTRGLAASVALFPRPAFSAATTSAASVGSPWTSQRPAS